MIDVKSQAMESERNECAIKQMKTIIKSNAKSNTQTRQELKL